MLLRIQSTLDSWLRCGEKYTKVIENMAKSWESHGPWCLLYRQLHQPGTAYLKNRKNFRARWFHPPLWVGMYLTWIKIRYILYASFHLNLRIFVAICSWFHGKIFNNCLQISVFWRTLSLNILKNSQYIVTPRNTSQIKAFGYTRAWPGGRYEFWSLFDLWWPHFLS